MKPNIYIPTTQEILLFRLMLCAIVLFFGPTYAIALLIYSFFVCQTYAVIISELCLFETENSLFRRLYSWFSFSLQWNSSSLFLYFLLSYNDIVLTHHSALLLNMCSRGTLVACCNYSKFLFLLLFIVYPHIS